ncbi:MAG: hypothetical protein RLZZ338_2975 [Cyanobacteriota bacterium]|jgi:hypothetical protein
MVTKFELRIPKASEISEEDLEQSAREIQEFEHNEIDNYDPGAMPDDDDFDVCEAWAQPNPGAMADDDFDDLVISAIDEDDEDEEDYDEDEDF